MIHAASASAATDARIPAEIEETLARQRLLSSLLNVLSERADLAQRTTLEDIPLRGPVLGLLRAADRRHRRKTSRIATMVLRHVRKEMRRIDPELDAFVERARIPTIDPALLDPNARKARFDAIMDALDRFDAHIREARARAAAELPPEAPGSKDADVFLQNELASAPETHCGSDRAETVRDVPPRVQRIPDPVDAGPGEGMRGGPVRRGIGTLDDPLIQPLSRPLTMEGLAPGRVPTIVIDAHSPPLFGPARDEWFRNSPHRPAKTVL